MFRKGRHTADVQQIMMRIHEDVTDCNEPVEGEHEEDVPEDEWPFPRLLDLRKANTRDVSASCECYGTGIG